MTTYPIPDFEGFAVGLQRLPSEAELFPDDDSIILGAYEATVQLLGTRRKYKIELMMSDYMDQGRFPISIWVATEIAANRITTHKAAGGRFRVAVGTLSFDAELSIDGVVARHRRSEL